MTVAIPAVTFPGAGTGRDMIGRPPAPSLLVIMAGPAAPAADPGRQPAPPRRLGDRSGLWLRNAAGGLCVLAAAAAAVSFTAQYRMAESARHLAAIAALAEEVTLLAAAGGITLWLLRLSMAPASTLSGFRAWVLEECSVAPGRRAARPAAPPAPLQPDHGGGTVPRKATKTARFLSSVTERHGPLASIPLDRVAAISAALAPIADLHPGAARAALRKAVLAAQNGSPS